MSDDDIYSMSGRWGPGRALSVPKPSPAPVPVWITYDPDCGYEEHGTEAEARALMASLLVEHRDAEYVHEGVEAVALYRCVRVLGIAQTVTDRAEDETEGGEECRRKGWDFKVRLDMRMFGHDGERPGDSADKGE